MNRRDRIVLRGMRFHALVGILAHEREIPQPLEVDLVVSLRQGAQGGERPRLVDYRQLYDLVATAVSRQPISYLEDVAEEISGAVLSLDGIQAVHVAVRKPRVPLPGPLQHVEVMVEKDAG